MNKICELRELFIGRSDQVGERRILEELGYEWMERKRLTTLQELVLIRVFGNHGQEYKTTLAVAVTG